MSNSPRAALARIFILLLVCCISAFAWEQHTVSGMQQITGTVISVKPVLAGKGGDHREFTIRYLWQGKAHVLITRRGIIDALGTLKNLSAGEHVALAIQPASPERAMLDTISNRYLLTLCFAILTIIFGTVVAIMVVKGRLPPSD
jgi:hypothetical protein